MLEQVVVFSIFAGSHVVRSSSHDALQSSESGTSGGRDLRSKVMSSSSSLPKNRLVLRYLLEDNS